MKGNVLAFDPAGDAGVIEGVDGNRYAFSRRDWQASSDPRAGLAVDFAADGAAATAIFTEAGAYGTQSAGDPVLWETIPFYRKRQFVIIGWLIFMPLGLLMLWTGPIYSKANDVGLPESTSNKVKITVLTIVIVVVMAVLIP